MDNVAGMAVATFPQTPAATATASIANNAAGRIKANPRRSGKSHVVGQFCDHTP